MLPRHPSWWATHPNGCICGRRLRCCCPLLPPPLSVCAAVSSSSCSIHSSSYRTQVYLGQLRWKWFLAIFFARVCWGVLGARWSHGKGRAKALCMMRSHAILAPAESCTMGCLAVSSPAASCRALLYPIACGCRRSSAVAPASCPPVFHTLCRCAAAQTCMFVLCCPSLVLSFLFVEIGWAALERPRVFPRVAVVRMV